jgi:GT2 family glycosyltransferase
MNSTKKILTVIVLYKRIASQSEAYQAIDHLIKNDPQVSDSIEFLLCDNTPSSQQPPHDFHGTYLSDTSNPGLAKHYNTALKLAAERGIPWLMLFDQDTSPTEEYLQELLSLLDLLTGNPDIVAILPKLHNGKKVQSPYALPTWSHKTVPAEQWGRSNTVLHGFNSGAVLRVSTMCSVGGFCEEFPLDYLDYVTFTDIQRHGGRVYVMKSTLHHQLAASNIHSNMPLVRYRTVVSSERAFYERYGTQKDRFYRRLRMLKTTLKHLLKDRAPSFALITFRAIWK